MATPKKIMLGQPGHHVVDVTPALAKSWLELNHSNRPLKRTKMTQYVRDMRDGNWRFTGEAIKFNTLGHLVDGQNRLHSLIDAQVTLSMLVVTGLQEDAQEVMDAGAPRSASDALQLRGYKNTQELAATVRTHVMWKQSGTWKHCMIAPGSDGNPSSAEIVQYAETHPDMLEAAVDGKVLARRLRLPTGAMGAAYYELLQVDRDDAKEFLARVVEFQTAGKGDPINTLIKRTQEMALRREHVRAPLGVYLLIRTWNSFRSDEYFEKFQLGSVSRGWALIPDPK